MLKIWTHLILSPLLFYFVLPAEDGLSIQKSEAPIAETASLPCSDFHINTAGVECESSLNSEIRLDFPTVDIDNVLAGNEFLPIANKVFHSENIVTKTEQYQSIEFGLRWEPVTPDFLQIYLNEYLPYWGNQIPYRLFWTLSYKVCPITNCDVWVYMEKRGEILPSDIRDLDSDLAVDVNYNGVPAGFWNTNVIR